MPISPPSKGISLGKQAELAGGSLLLLLLMGNFPSRFAPSPHPRAPKSSSYLFLLWREAFLGDPLSFVEFLPSPAWKTPVLGAERKSHLSFYGPGLCASQEPGSDQ